MESGRGLGGAGRATRFLVSSLVTRKFSFARFVMEREERKTKGGGRVGVCGGVWGGGGGVWGVVDLS